MRKTILYCKSGRSPYLCGGECNSCFSQAVRMADYCAKCGIELIYDDEKSLCRDCMKKLERNESKWESQSSYTGNPGQAKAEA